MKAHIQDQTVAEQMRPHEESDFHDDELANPVESLESDNQGNGQFPSELQHEAQAVPELDSAGPEVVTAEAPPVAPRRAREATGAETTTRLFWMLATAAIVMGIWRIGPRIVEEYQFAITTGKVRAEYQNAVQILKDGPLDGVSKSYQLVAQKVRPSVVSVKTIRRSEGTRGQGSGVVMSEDGYILTNAHVVQNAEYIEVILYDRHRYRATLVGADVDSDLAVVKIDAPELIPAQWGDSEDVEVGSIVWAIGSPYGLNQTVTSGIISGKHRRDEKHSNRELFQTDAAVNPGNSGGPLVDAAGMVIGINTSIYGETFQGISFAVPSVIAKFVFKQLVENGQVTRGFLGVFPDMVFQDTAKKMNLPNLDGALITGIQPNSPAYQSGLQVNDVILQWDNNPITVHTMLYRLVEMSQPDETVNVVIARDGELRQLDIQVGNRPAFPREN